MSSLLPLLLVFSPAQADEVDDAAEGMVSLLESLVDVMQGERDCDTMVMAMRTWGMQHGEQMRFFNAQLESLEPEREKLLTKTYQKRLTAVGLQLSASLQPCAAHAELTAVLELIAMPTQQPVKTKADDELEGLCTEWLSVLDSHEQDCVGLGKALEELFVRREAQRVLRATQTASGDEKAVQQEALKLCQDAIARTLFCGTHAEVKAAMELLQGDE
ncbi:MAG: hypothetical protein RBU37_15010 [Myxococcota bacterium]|jgi:hypothetical protein|nr:hypothetical protein [Myxococcota bacterium]